MNDNEILNNEESVVGMVIATAVVTIAAVVAVKGLLDTATYFRRRSAEKKILEGIIERNKEAI